MYDYTTKEKTTDEKKKSSLNYTGIPQNMQNKYAMSSGLSLDSVRINYNFDHPQKNRALAYTQGNPIHVEPKNHELGHVIQKMQGGVRTVGQVNEISLNDHSALEHETESGIIQHCFNKRKPTDGVVQCIRTKNGNLSENEIKLKKWIDDVRDLILKKEYESASDKLCSCNQFGITVTINPIVINYKEDMIKFVQPDNFTFTNETPIRVKIRIPIPNVNKMIVKEEFYSQQYDLFWSMHLWSALEEYMHAYQALTNTYISEDTYDFATKSNLDRDYDESDILAAFMEWGIHPDLFNNQYEIRREFYKYKTGNEVPINPEKMDIAMLFPNTKIRKREYLPETPPEQNTGTADTTNMKTQSNCCLLL